MSHLWVAEHSRITYSMHLDQMRVSELTIAHCRRRDREVWGGGGGQKREGKRQGGQNDDDDIVDVFSNLCIAY